MRIMLIPALLSIAGCVAHTQPNGARAEERPGSEHRHDDGYGGAHSSDFFQPDSAEASSEWSSSYRVAYTIDGSGMPPNFGPDDAHEKYSSNNHWTTEDDDIEGAWARYFFDEPRTIDTFLMWNHRSTRPPAYSEGYAVTLFDLEFFDAEGQLVGRLTDQTAVGDTKTAQVYTFEPMHQVSSVLFTIRENDGERRVTGLAEVGFGLSR